jgi:hypothetical protein
MNPHVVVIDGAHLHLLLRELNSDPPPHSLRVWMDDGGTKFKLDNSTWSPPLGHPDEVT